MAAWLGKDVAKFVKQPPEIKINPNGVDLKVSEVWKIGLEEEAVLHGSTRTVNKKLILPENDDFYHLERGVYDVRIANEVTIPMEAVGLCFPRSTLNRLGTIKSDGGVWDSGYKGFGTQTLLVPIKKIKIHKDEFWFQLMLFSNKDIAEIKYEGHWQGEKPNGGS
jgi:dUTP pyrophosphatase